MNRTVFRLLVFLMSLSMIGIILVQLYLINTSLKNNEEQFKYHVNQVLDDVAEKLSQEETFSFYQQYNMLKDSIGKDPKRSELLDFFLVQKNRVTNETVIYSNSIIAEDFNVTLFDSKKDSIKAVNLVSKSRTEVYNGSSIDKSAMQHSQRPDKVFERRTNLDIVDKVRFEAAFHEIAETKPLRDRVTKEHLAELLGRSLHQAGVRTPFEFAIYSHNIVTKVKSDNFTFDKEGVFQTKIFEDQSGNSTYQMFVTFPEKQQYIFSELLGITILSIVFTLVIIIAYSSALSQLIKQRQISEIKTDFINNMTHEFKTPIATINLALDAMKNPKVRESESTMGRYLGMIREENKRMHAQVENVLRISKLEKKELDIAKESSDIHDIIDDATEHVHLIIEDRGGTITKHYGAQRGTVLLNDVHFTNVIVNILDNAIKYSPDAPIIDIYTENVKDFVIIRIQDRGSGMSKAAQKRIFEKFYREHTGDLHNVKGHGLGLAYVKRIVDDHNGQIAVESEKGKGSTFIVKLPLIN